MGVPFPHILTITGVSQCLNYNNLIGKKLFQLAFSLTSEAEYLFTCLLDISVKTMSFILTAILPECSFYLAS